MAAHGPCVRTAAEEEEVEEACNKPNTFFQVDMICDVSKFGGMFYLTNAKCQLIGIGTTWYHFMLISGNFVAG